jgi:TonB family protein
MRTIKSQLKRWKLAALAAVLPSMFFFVACQDQVESEITEIARNSTHALIVPNFIRERFEQLKKENPAKNYALLELNRTASEKLDALRTQFGLPKSVEVFRTINGKSATEAPLHAQAQTIEGKLVFEIPSGNQSDLLQSDKHSERLQESGIVEVPGGVETGSRQARQEGEQVFAIIEFNDQTGKAAQEGKIYTVVENVPEYPGGIDALMSFIKQNLRYPLDARQQGIEGTVYASFVVETDGAIDSVKIIRGISATCDQEVRRVVELFPNWKPGTQSGNVVRVRFVLPIRFGL